MKKILVLASLLAFATMLASVQAQSEEDSFFGDDPLINEDAQVNDSYEENFLKEEPLTWGGSYRFGVRAGAFWDKYYTNWTSEYFWAADGEDSGVDLGATLFFTARPSADTRYYGKFKIDYPFETKYVIDGTPDTTISVPSFKVWELYADFDIENTVNVRAGKQMAKWGVGYFFQPADVISLSPVDPEKPEQEREGPVMIKLNLPLDVHNLDAYIIAPEGMSSAKDIAYALRASIVAGGFEYGLGARYQYVSSSKVGSAFQAIATASGSINKVTVFAEGLAKYGTSKNFLVRDSNGNVQPGIPVSTYKTTTRQYDWFPSGSVGFSWSESEWFLSLMGQYFYNGEGYAGDITKLTGPAMAQVMTVMSGMVPTADSFSYGDAMNLAQHYAAARLSYSFTDNSKVSFATMWMGNLQDGSGIIMPSVSIKATDEVTLGLNAHAKYGLDKTEYISNPAFHYLKVGFTLDLAGGNF